MTNAYDSPLFVSLMTLITVYIPRLGSLGCNFPPTAGLTAMISQTLDLHVPSGCPHPTKQHLGFNCALERVLQTAGKVFGDVAPVEMREN